MSLTWVYFTGLSPCRPNGCSNSNRYVRFGPKVGQFGPKWEKSGTFFRSDFGIYFGSWNKNLLKFDLKMSWICNICGYSDPL